MIGKRVIFAGRVQGVGFRYTTREVANGFDVCGTVKNLPDGTVELVVAGEPDEVDAYLLEITDESPVAHFIKEVHADDITPPDNLRGFRIVS